MKFKTPKYILPLALFACMLSYTSAQAQTLEDINQVYSKALTKYLTNTAGNLYSTDTMAEFMKAQRVESSIYVGVVVERPGTTTQSLEMNSRTSTFAKITDFKNKIEMVRRYGTTELSVNGAKLPAYSYFDNTYKYIAGNIAETYLSTQKSLDANQKNIVSSIDSKLKKKGLPTTLRNTVVNKIYASQNIKLTRTESLSSLDTILGLAPETSILENVNTTKIKDTFLTSIGSIFKVKEDKGLTKYEYEYSPNVWSSEKAIKSFDVRKIVLSVDTDTLANLAIQKNAANLVTTDIIGNASSTDVRQLLRNIYGDLTIEILVDAQTYDVRSIYVPMYEISYAENGTKETLLFEALAEEAPTGLTAITAPKKFITPKAIRNYYLKY